MGLSIHYKLTSRGCSPTRVPRLVERMRQLALDLPFEHVDDEITHLDSTTCARSSDDLRDTDETKYRVFLAAKQLVGCPWGKKLQIRHDCRPLEVYSFLIVPGPGCQPTNIGLARYPAEMEVTYRVREDDRFVRAVKEHGMTTTSFDRQTWERSLKRRSRSRLDLPAYESSQEQRNIKTGLGSGWHYAAFCKTQYASNPRCGGVGNFLRCHMSLVHLLDRIAELPTIKVTIDDDANYGPSYHTEDPSSDTPVYSWHAGKYNVRALVKEVGDWNEAMAGMVGAVADLLEVAGSDGCSESQITRFPNFEQLEFRGQNLSQLQAFLRAMSRLAEQQRAKSMPDDAQ